MKKQTTEQINSTNKKTLIKGTILIIFISTVLIIFLASTTQTMISSGLISINVYSCRNQVEIGSYEGTPSEEEARVLLENFLTTNHNFTKQQARQLNENKEQIIYNQKYGGMTDTIIYVELYNLIKINFLNPEKLFSLPSNINGFTTNDDAFILEKNKIYVLRNEPCRNDPD